MQGLDLVKDLAELERELAKKLDEAHQSAKQRNFPTLPGCKYPLVDGAIPVFEDSIVLRTQDRPLIGLKHLART